MVGATHWEGATFAANDLPGPEPVLFFAPSVGEKRAAALATAYTELVEGSADPRKGLVFTL